MAHWTTDASCRPWIYTGRDQNCLVFWRSFGRAKRWSQGISDTMAPVMGDPQHHSGGLASHMLLNFYVDSLVRHWFLLTAEDGSIVHDGLGHVAGKSLDVFYSENGILISCDPKWLQGTLRVLIGLFRKIVLADNFVKSKTMNFQMGAIRSGMSQEAFGQHSTE